MRAEHKVVLSQTAFAKAAKATFRGKARPKRAVHNFLAIDTRFYAEDGALVIATPLMISRIVMTGNWNIHVSVNSKMLALMAANLKPSKITTIAYAAGKVIIDEGLFALKAEVIESWDWG